MIPHNNDRLPCFSSWQDACDSSPYVGRSRDMLLFSIPNGKLNSKDAEMMPLASSRMSKIGHGVPHGCQERLPDGGNCRSVLTGFFIYA
jgi:hypothetical protein